MSAPKTMEELAARIAEATKDEPDAKFVLAGSGRTIEEALKDFWPQMQEMLDIPGRIVWTTAPTHEADRDIKRDCMVHRVFADGFVLRTPVTRPKLGPGSVVMITNAQAGSLAAVGDAHAGFPRPS